MRRLITPVAITTALIAAGALSSASADETTPTPPPPTTPTTATAPRLLTINGLSEVTLRSDAGKTLFVQTYRAQLSGALDDAAAKATALATKAGMTLGAIQSITENSDSPWSGCDGGPMVAEGMVSAGAPVASKHRTVKRHHTATKPKKAQGRASIASAPDYSNEDDVYPCEVSATVTVAYAIS